MVGNIYSRTLLPRNAFHIDACKTDGVEAVMNASLLARFADGDAEVTYSFGNGKPCCLRKVSLSQ